MKKNWTKVLVVLLTLTMVLSLVACGGKKGDETTKAPETTKTPTTTAEATTAEATTAEATTAEATTAPEGTEPEGTEPEGTEPEGTEPEGTEPEGTEPEGTEPEATEPEATEPEATEPEATEPEATTAPEATQPEATQPSSGISRPTNVTIEDRVTDGDAENWVYEIDKTTETIVIDGVIEEAAYFTPGNAIYLVSEINPAASGSYFDVFMTADDTHIYVFYEFFKNEQIFWDDTIGASTPYWFDCVDFCLNRFGTKGAGTEFRIYAKTEGGPDAEGFVDGGYKNAGVDALYVKHTETGYTVEFSIPLDLIKGAEENGDRRISFTALSTITTAMGTNDAGEPTVTRVYSAACCAAGALDKENPSYLVIKDSKPVEDEGVEGPKVEDGRYVYTLNAGTEALALDGVKDEAYADGLVWEAKYSLVKDHNMADKFINAEANTFTVYMAADAENVYVLFEILDDKIVGADAASAWYRGDCADIIISKAANVTEGTGADARIFGDKEGGLGTADARGLEANGITDLYVKTTEGGYNVELKIARSQFTDPTEFGFLAMIGACPLTKDEEGGNGAVSVYPCIENFAGEAGNNAKNLLNKIVINDVETPVEPSEAVGKTDKGANIYETTKAAAALTVDGVKDAAYADGVILVATHNIPASGSTFNVYLAADETHVYFLYEFIKNEDIFYNANYTSYWHEDCANPVVSVEGFDGYSNSDEFHILGGIEGGMGVAAVGDAAKIANIGVDNYFVKHTAKGYNVEFSIPYANITGADANGDKMISFTAVATIDTEWLDQETGAPSKTYAFASNGVDGVDQNTVKQAPAFLIVKGTATTPEAPESSETPESSATPESSETPESSATPESSETPESSATPESSETPESSATPESSETPESSATPESSETETPVAPSTKPTANTAPTATTEKGNWIFEIEASETALVLDGVLDEAYANGIVLLAERNLPTSKAGYEDSEATLYVYATADETHIYFLYEIIKDNGEIFFDADYSPNSWHHLDCVDFVLSLAGAEASGTEFHILGATEGDKATAKIKADPAAAGVDNWYVKHTDAGYNVEFSIPLEKVVGVDANGDKMISFTALSTITLGWPEGAAAPDRVYTCAAKGSTATNEDKANPNFLVIKGTATEDGPQRTEDGRYAYTLNAGVEALALDGVKDDAYANGLTFEAEYALPTEEDYALTVYIAADADNVYILYEIKDAKIVGADNASAWYRGDCADLIFSIAANATEGTSADVRIFGDKEGGLGTADARDIAKAGITDLYVKHTEGGYNVELKIARSQFADRNVFSFLAMSGACRTDKAETGTTSTTVYPCIANAAGEGGNNAKAKLNQVTIVDYTADGRYAYTLNAGAAALALDGVMDDAYANGLTFEAKYALPTEEEYALTVYLAADAENVYILYVIKDAKIVGADNASAWYRGDCADLILSVAANATEGTGNDVRIFGDKEGGLGTADARDIAKAGITDLYVKHTEDGYNVELKIARSQFTNKNVFSFLAMSGACRTDKAETGTTSTTVYPCIENVAGEGGNNAKAKLNQVTIIDAQ